MIEPFFTPSRFFLTGWDTSLIQPKLNSGYDIAALDGACWGRRRSTRSAISS